MTELHSGLPEYPFGGERFIGTIYRVGTSFVEAYIPQAAQHHGPTKHGKRVGGGEVGEFVFLDAGEEAVLGRIFELKAGDKEEARWSAGRLRELQFSPTSRIQLLASVDLVTREVLNGVRKLPRIGAAIYSVTPAMLRWVTESLQQGQEKGGIGSIRLSRLSDLPEVELRFTPEALFGRHCAVLGTTGGGKSWTISRLVEEAGKLGIKVILLDATGEFYTQSSNTRHVYFGEHPSPPTGEIPTAFPYRFLTENDLFAIFRPSGQVQAPKLRSAMKSLKLIELDPSLETDGLLIKRGRKKDPYVRALKANYTAIDGVAASFDISKLAKQVEEECIWPTARNDSGAWGDFLERDLSYCTSLVMRIEERVGSPALKDILNPGERKALPEVIDEFLRSDDNILRVSLQYLPFELNAKEIVVNAIGRYLLEVARSGYFRKNQACVVALDEAHNFLNRELSDEWQQYKLDSFALIAKEGRKHWLTICLATQRARDIPEDVLSQIGALIVHKITNPRDRELVEKASGDIDRAAAEELPGLVRGEAVMVGVEMPFPLAVQILRPRHIPDSRGPDFAAGNIVSLLE